MRGLLAAVVLVASGWAVWSYVLRPALQPAPTPPPTALIVHPTATPRPAPSSQEVAVSSLARGFLSAWAAGRYGDMYRALAPAARRAITRAAFVDRYRGIAAEATLRRVQPAMTALAVDGARATVTYTVDMATAVVGPLHYTATMPLHHEGGHWGIAWTPDLIFPGLGQTYRVHLFQEPSHRGTIVDRFGRPLALDTHLRQVGVVPQYIANEKSLLAFLSGWLHMPRAQIRALYHVPWAVRNPTDFVPITTVTSVQWDAVQQQALRQENNGLDVVPGSWRRAYPQGTLAAALLGYVNASNGHGATGLEQWADGYLTGHDGARLAIVTAPDFQYTISTIKERPVQNGATIHLTLDATLQAAAEKALAGKVGAVVALRPSDGAVLAMASAPGYDPNGFVTGLTPAQYRALVASPHAPLINHATMGRYPPGSIFKIVAMGAALEQGSYTATTRIAGPPVWHAPGSNLAMHDWNPAGHGVISLHEALVQSCDTCFYQLGLHLDQINHDLLPDDAREWGFGAPTDLLGVNEAAGVIPDPHWTLRTLGRPWVPGNAVNMAIGQGYVEVTPLQVAQMLAALGNNGVMYRPYVVQRITAANGAVLRAFPPIVTRRLPVSSAHRVDILQAMLGVTTEPQGTAAGAFAGFRWPVAGKTGTAQANSGGPHAWFAALAPADHPRIALVVLVEHGGEGARVAAPIARQLLQTFFTQVHDLAGTAPPGGPTVLPVP
jgi:penicillin-binding protein 2